jgi:hypothetical protein
MSVTNELSRAAYWEEQSRYADINFYEFILIRVDCNHDIGALISGVVLMDPVRQFYFLAVSSSNLELYCLS